MPTTSNFGWTTPADTDLVKDGAAAIRTLGNGIDTSLVDLKGGTTGQYLVKQSNTDLDFTWTTNTADIDGITATSPLTGGGTSGTITVGIQDGTTAQKGAVQLTDSISSTSTTTAATPNSVKTAYDLANGAIAKSLVDAKADLITATADNTPARLAVGNNGETLIADSSATTGLRWQGNFAAGKNKIINGDFNIWQRGTSVNLTNNTEAFQADRWICYSTFSAGTSVYSRQTFTPGTAPVAGYEGKFFARLAAGTTSTYGYFRHKIEDVQTFAGQTVTISIWAKASGTGTLAATIYQNFGSGGSAAVLTSTSSQSLSSSWTRYTWTVAIPSISGKTVGTSSFLDLYFEWSGTLGGQTLDIWGAQIENGNTATAFQTATGTLAGELAACQRYYQRVTNTSGNAFAAMGGYGLGLSTTAAYVFVPLPVQMRVAPTTLDYGNMSISDLATRYSSGTYGLIASSPTVAGINYTHGTAVLTQFRPYTLQADNSTSAYVGFGAEL